MKISIRPGGIVILIGLIFITTESHLFGWNAFPNSQAEALCDGIGLLIVVLGIGINAIDKK